MSDLPNVDSVRPVERDLLGILFPILGHDAEESRDLRGGQRSSHVWNVSSHVTTSNSASRFISPPTSWATLERSLSALNQGDIIPESQALVNSVIDPSAQLLSYPAEEVRMLAILHQTQRALVDAQQTHAKATFITEVGWNPSEHDLPVICTACWDCSRHSTTRVSSSQTSSGLLVFSVLLRRVAKTSSPTSSLTPS
jgi:hypothetical protein